jgi:adenosylcobinamide kinase/adenosylcobinamide-phosphate guanylyltransferase
MQANTSKTVTLVLGGARSGKSQFAQDRLIGEGRVAFIATAEGLDEEMRQRISRHRAERPAGWTTLEVPLALEDAILQCSGKFDTILIDCLTLWTSNLMMAEDSNSERIFVRAAKLCDALRQVTCSVVLVSNEVGSGVVPATDSGRLFRDLLGGVNRHVAAIADKVLLLVAGYPLTVKDAAASDA